jgi:hypothetical protein
MSIADICILVVLVTIVVFTYKLGHWNGAASAHRYHIDRMLAKEDRDDEVS